MIVALTGGTGGAKLVEGLAAVIDPSPTFAPDENGVQIAIQYPGGSWSIDLPAT